MQIILHHLHRILKLYWSIRRPLTLGVKGMVFDKDENILLIRHTYIPGWHLPGGAVEKGETLIDSVRREVREEAGVICAEAPEVSLGAYTNFAECKNDHVVVFVFREWEHDPHFRRRIWEIEEVGFFPLDQLPEDTSAATRKRLDEYFERRSKDYMW